MNARAIRYGLTIWLSRRTISALCWEAHEHLISTYLFRLWQTSLSSLLVVADLENLRLLAVLQEPPYLLIRLLLIILQYWFHNLLLSLGLLSQGLRLGEYLFTILIHELFEHIELLLLSPFFLLWDAEIGLQQRGWFFLCLLSLFLMLWLSLLIAFV